MTDTTPEQRAAFERMDEYAKDHWAGQMGNDWRVVSNALPAELTSPQYKLPSEPKTAWLDTEGDIWVVNAQGRLSCPGVSCENPSAYAPFTRLVPERPTITRVNVKAALMGHTHDEQVDAILALVNGKGAES